MNVGIGGADVSLGTIAASIAGLDAWRVNAELWTSKELEAHKYTSAMRTLYSVGGAAEKALYDEVLSGKTNIAERRDGEYSAKTEANGDGTKTIYIGREALAKGSRFGLNVLLAHEAYRNGIDDGEVGQREETDRAVLGHIGAAYALGQAYGIGAIGEALGKEVATYLTALSTGNMDDLARLLASYDASGDYWRLRKDGSLEYDGKADLYDEDGKLMMRGENGDIWMSLIKFVGRDKAKELVGKSGQTIKDADLARALQKLVSRDNWMDDRAFGQLFNGTIKIQVREELMELRYGVKAIWESLDQKFKNQVVGGLSTFEKVFADYMEYDEVVKAGNPAKWLHQNIVQGTINGRTMYMNRRFVEEKDQDGKSIAERIGEIMFKEGVHWAARDGILCIRTATNSDRLSDHGLGLAIDIASIINDYLSLTDDPDMLLLVKGLTGKDLKVRRTYSDAMDAYDFWKPISDQVAALSTTNANWRVDTADRYKALSEISPLLNGGKSLNEEQYKVLEKYDYAEKDKDGNYTLKPGAAAAVTSYLKDNQALYELIKYEIDPKTFEIKNTIRWNNLIQKNYYRNGFVNMSREFVRFMTQDLGMEWGGTYGRAVDAMHFSYKKLEKWRW
ncbi:hypothetical protein [Treponema sp. J25]|uniref:hypothetical protein n=1 Tax=Treponema sp. J25 TaxID=2094121 RepID=UPI001053AEA0|nr:hypothetical protein [Treponema sp. J25]